MIEPYPPGGLASHGKLRAAWTEQSNAGDAKFQVTIQSPMDPCAHLVDTQVHKYGCRDPLQVQGIYHTSTWTLNPSILGPVGAYELQSVVSVAKRHGSCT